MKYSYQRAKLELVWPVKNRNLDKYYSEIKLQNTIHRLSEIKKFGVERHLTFHVAPIIRIPVPAACLCAKVAPLAFQKLECT